MSDRILIVDDDQQITSFLARYLEKQGYEVLCAATGKETRAALEQSRIDLCVLDIGLPDIDGFQLMREIRQSSNLPIVVLSVRDETFDRIFGLEFGADDYVCKPFEPRELVARIRAVLRRAKVEQLARQQVKPGQTLLQFGTWILNTGARTLVHADSAEDARLTTSEFEILRAFVEQPRTVLSREQLLDLVRGPSIYVGDRTIDVHIMRLRKKIESDPSDPTLIKTVHGIGYCLAEDVIRFEKPSETDAMSG